MAKNYKAAEPSVISLFSLILGGFAFAVEEALELAEARGVAHFPQGLGLDLANTFAGDLELFADFLQRAAVAVGEAEA